MGQSVAKRLNNASGQRLCLSILLSLYPHITNIKMFLTYTAVFVRCFTPSSDFPLFKKHWTLWKVKKGYLLYNLRIIFARFNCTRSHVIYCIYSIPPRTLCCLCVQTYQNIFVYESSNYEHLSEKNLDIRDAKWFIYFECLSTLLSLYIYITFISIHWRI